MCLVNELINILDVEKPGTTFLRINRALVSEFPNYLNIEPGGIYLFVAVVNFSFVLQSGEVLYL